MTVAMLFGMMSVMSFAAEGEKIYSFTPGMFAVSMTEDKFEKLWIPNAGEQSTVQDPWRYDRVYVLDKTEKVNFISVATFLWGNWGTANAGKVLSPEKTKIYYTTDVIDNSICDDAVDEWNNTYKKPKNPDLLASMTEVSYKVTVIDQPAQHADDNGGVNAQVLVFAFDQPVDARSIVLHWDVESIGGLANAASATIGYSPNVANRKVYSFTPGMFGVSMTEDKFEKLWIPNAGEQSTVQDPWRYDRVYVLDKTEKVNFISVATFLWGNWGTANAGKVLSPEKTKIYYTTDVIDNSICDDAVDEWNNTYKKPKNPDLLASMTEVSYKVTVVDQPAQHADDNGGVNAQVLVFAFDQPVDARSIVLHWDAESIGGLANAAYATVGYAPAASGSSADTGDMLTVSIAVASVAILGTAAAISMKKRKED